MSDDSVIERVEGPTLVLRGSDIDTDRIMPARFLKAVTFDGLDRHLFADDRAAAQTGGDPHPLDRPSARSARILLTNQNFGCGSSREHAPQALYRWGFRAVVAESFAEIFAGNAQAIGLVCVSVATDAMTDLMNLGDESTLTLDLRAGTVTAPGAGTWPVSLPASARHAWLSGEWDATRLLLDNYDEVDRIDARLPYLRTTSRNA